MNLKELIGITIEVSYKSYKKLGNGCNLARKLDRHESISVDGYELSCWKEYTLYRVSEYLKEKIPNMKVELELDGNDSTITLELTDEQERKITGILYSFLKENNAI